MFVWISKFEQFEPWMPYDAVKMDFLGIIYCIYTYIYICLFIYLNLSIFMYTYVYVCIYIYTVCPWNPQDAKFWLYIFVSWCFVFFWYYVKISTATPNGEPCWWYSSTSQYLRLKPERYPRFNDENPPKSFDCIVGWAGRHCGLFVFWRLRPSRSSRFIWRPCEIMLSHVFHEKSADRMVTSCESATPAARAVGGFTSCRDHGEIPCQTDFRNAYGSWNPP